MIIFETKKIFQQMIDLQLFDRFKYRKYFEAVTSIFVIILFVLMAFMSFLDFIMNFNVDFSKVPISVLLFSGYSCYAIIYCNFLQCRADFYGLFDAMEAIVNESVYLKPI